MQRHCADVNSPYKRKCWTNSGGPLTNSLLWECTARESLCVDSQNITCVSLKRRGSWVISVYLWFPLTSFISWCKVVATIGLEEGRDQDTCRETTEVSKVSLRVGYRYSSYSKLAGRGGGGEGGWTAHIGTVPVPLTELSATFSYAQFA
jgi:hypothetical protein